MRKTMRIIVETYDYGVKYTDSYIDMDHFRGNVYENEGYVVTCDDMIIDSRNIKAAYPEIKELENENKKVWEDKLKWKNYLQKKRF